MSKDMSKLLKIAIGILVAMVLVILLKSDGTYEFYKKLMGKYDEIDNELIEKYNALQNKMEEDSVYYNNALKIIEEQYDLQLKEANTKYEQLNRKYKRNAKELDEYRNSGFDHKFVLFARTVTGKDTVQGF